MNEYGIEIAEDAVVMDSPYHGISNRFPMELFMFATEAIERLHDQIQYDMFMSTGMAAIGNCPFQMIPGEENIVVHEDGSATVVSPLGIIISQNEETAEVGYIADLIVGRLTADEYGMVTQGSWGGLMGQEIEA